MVETGASQVDRLDIPEDIAAVDLTKVNVFAQAQPDGVFAGTAVEQAAAVQQCVVPVCGGMVKDAQVELARLHVGGVAPCRLDGPRANSNRAFCRTRRLDEAKLVGISLAQAGYGIDIVITVI